MLLIDLFETEETASMKKNAKTPKKPEKDAMCFPKKEVWHHVSSGGKKDAGWSQIDKNTKETGEPEKVKSVSSTSVNRPVHNRDTAPKGVNKKYQKFVKEIGTAK